MSEIAWSDGGWSVTCPDCGESWADLWDYEWGQREEIDIECPVCNTSLVLHRSVSVDYGVSKPSKATLPQTSEQANERNGHGDR